MPRACCRISRTTTTSRIAPERLLISSKPAHPVGRGRGLLSPDRLGASARTLHRSCRYDFDSRLSSATFRHGALPCVGQHCKLHGSSLPITEKGQSLEEAAGVPRRHEDVSRLENTSFLTCPSSSRDGSGTDDVWSSLGTMVQQDRLRDLANLEAVDLRDDLLLAALGSKKRLQELVDVAQQLHAELGFRWPDFYVRIIHYYLAHACYDDAVFWHWRIARSLPPSPEAFMALLLTFVVDPNPEIQRALTTLYVDSTERRLYDSVVPTLFESGYSGLARAWRKTLLVFGDTPSTSRTQPFLVFLAQYYSRTHFTKEEVAVLQRWDVAARLPDGAESQPAHTDTSSTASLSDLFVAKLFASTWTSTEFTLHFVYGLGLLSVGPRSLQSLALREADASGVAKRITQIEKMGMKISEQVYCKVLVHFAKTGEDELLQILLHCDVHPDEFEDIETRQMLMVSSIRSENSRMKKLMQEIDSVTGIENRLSYPQSGAVSNLESKARKQLGWLHEVSEPFEALDSANHISQSNATLLLGQAFRGIGFHPRVALRDHASRQNLSLRLARAITVTRRLARFDAAIRSQFWRLLLYNLGRLGRFEELEQLSLEIVGLFKPPLHGGLIPVHIDDMPPVPRLKQPDEISRADPKILRARKMARAAWRHMEPSKVFDTEFEQEESQRGRPVDTLSGKDFSKEKSYIPADLPLSHLEHPLRELFDIRLQRSVIRWGFDQALLTEPNDTTLINTRAPNSSHFDLARGVRLLAKLRDEGVFVDRQMIRSVVIARIAVARVPNRGIHRSRDSNELSTERLKHLVDMAWGSEILPSVTELHQTLRKKMHDVRERYDFSFDQADVRRFRG